MTVRAKPASTVVLVNEASQIYLTKRPKTMKFLGGFYVFPGGAVDREDDFTDSIHIKNQEANSEVGLDFYVAAARELYEEVGILLATKEDGSPLQLNEKSEEEYRRQLIKGELTFLQFLKKEKLFFDLNRLKYFGNLVTPEGFPIRFDTQFFLAKLPSGQEPKPDAYEIEDSFWTSPHEAVSAYERGELPMIEPTILSLHAVINNQKGEPLQLPDFHDFFK